MVWLPKPEYYEKNKDKIDRYRQSFCTYLYYLYANPGPPVPQPSTLGVTPEGGQKQCMSGMTMRVSRHVPDRSNDWSLTPIVLWQLVGCGAMNTFTTRAISGFPTCMYIYV
jgi:hypothetical protein